MKKANQIEVLTQELAELEARRSTLTAAQTDVESKLKSVQAAIDLGDTSGLPEVAALRSQVLTLGESLERVAASISEKQMALAAAQEAARVEVLWGRVLELTASDNKSTEEFNAELQVLKAQFEKTTALFIAHQDAAEAQRMELSRIKQTLGLDELAFIRERSQRLATAGATVIKREDLGTLFPAFNIVTQNEERRRSNMRQAAASTLVAQTG